jgi:hypothetical protein
MNYIVTIPTLGYSKVLEQCINSVINSDYSGNIYILSPDDKCMSLVKDRVIVNINHNITTTGDMIANLVNTTDIEADTLIYIHNDVKVHPEWISNFDRGWNSIDKDKVWALSLQYINIHDHNNNNTLEDYTSMMYNEFISKHTGDLIATMPINNSHILGMGTDMYNRNIYNGRISVCCSISLNCLRDMIAIYGIERVYSFSIELYMLELGIDNKMWSFWIESCPVLHLVGYDTYTFIKSCCVDIMPCYTDFLSQLGYNFNHLISKWANKITNKYKKEILDAASYNNLSSVDYIFDEARKEINNFNCKDCTVSQHCYGKHNPHT